MRMSLSPRTDLAQEAHALRSAADAPGVQCREEDGITRLCIETEEAARRLGLPKGNYVNLSLQPLLRREDEAFEALCAQISGELAAMLPREGCILAAALGNPAMTPDALGSLTADSILATRHLGALLPGFRSVCVLRCGVLGTTGLESAALVKAAVGVSGCAAVIAVDGLCAADSEKLCAAVQLSDSGIVPGSGVGNSRMALNRDTLGVPVISLGVPTVIDAGSLGGKSGMFVTTRDIDQRLKSAAKLLGYSINMALHPGLTPADIDLLL